MSYGKQAARNIDLQLTESDRWSKILPDIYFSQEAPQETSPNRRHTGNEIAVSKRARSQEEVVNGLTHEEVLDEACRCLRCDIKVANVS